MAKRKFVSNKLKRAINVFVSFLFFSGLLGVVAVFERLQRQNTAREEKQAEQEGEREAGEETTQIQNKSRRILNRIIMIRIPSVQQSSNERYIRTP